MPAFNPSYFPVSYQPAQIVYPQQYQQPMMQNQNMQNVQPVQPVQPVQQMQGQSSILWVRNGQEAAMYPVAPNNAVALWDSSSPVIYLKQADASGKPSMKIYDLVERSEMPQDASKSSESNNETFATKTDLVALASVVKDYDTIIAELKKDVEFLKETPAKKSVKKVDTDA